jgi:hypothetical protein
MKSQVQYLFNSKGNWIVTEFNQNIYSPDHVWLGWLDPKTSMVWTSNQQYLGTVLLGDRFLFIEHFLLIHPTYYPHPSLAFPVFPNYPGDQRPSIELPPFVQDVIIRFEDSRIE